MQYKELVEQAKSLANRVAELEAARAQIETELVGVYAECVKGGFPVGEIELNRIKSAFEIARNARAGK